MCLSRKKEQKAEKPSGKPHRAPFMQKVHQTREEQASDYNDDIPVVTDSSLFHLTGITQVQPFKWSIASPYEWKSIQALLVTDVVAGQGAKCL